MSFANKVVLITGGSCGIGAATAMHFAAEDADIAIVGRNAAKLQDIAQKCTRNGKTPLIIRADIVNDEEAKTIIPETIKKYGKLDILINNAGIVRKDSIVSDKIMECYDEIMNTNLRAAILLTNLAVPYLIATKGNIINVSSILGTITTNKTISYSISKAGLDHFSRCIALELASSKVRVNTVSPGAVKTDIIKNAGLNHDWPSWEECAAKLPLGKVSSPEEVAHLIAFLASDKAESITGANYSIDNGAKLQR